MSQNDLVTANMAPSQLVAMQGRAYARVNPQNAKPSSGSYGHFAQVLKQSQANTSLNSSFNSSSIDEGGWSKTLVSGDTLTGVIKQQAASQGVELSASQAFAMVSQLAKANGIANPNKVFAGQKIDLSCLQ